MCSGGECVCVCVCVLLFTENHKKEKWEDGYPRRAQPELQELRPQTAAPTHTHTHTHSPPEHTEIVKIIITLYAYENCKPSGIPKAQKQIVNNQGS